MAREITQFSNEILEQLTSVNDSIENAVLDIQRYPGLAAFYRTASAYTSASATKSDSNPASEIGVMNSIVNICGGYATPRPDRAAPWIDRSSPNPEQTLTSDGYHATPNFAGGGYTRPRTWKWWHCGWNTFRDHAYITGPTTYREQTYIGWTPNGEPNPKVYASGPWPYPDWPAYVYWWHVYGPGR